MRQSHKLCAHKQSINTAIEKIMFYYLQAVQSYQHDNDYTQLGQLLSTYSVRISHMESDVDTPTSRQGGYHSIIICKKLHKTEL